MTTRIILFGQTKLFKKNPWFSGKLARLVKMGLAKPKKDMYIVADPPPWFGDPSKLSKAQIYQALRFAAASHRMKGKPLDERIRYIKKEAAGPTKMARKKHEIELPRIKKLLTVARAKGIEIPPELQGIEVGGMVEQEEGEEVPVIMA